MDIIATAYNSTDHSLDYRGQPLKGDPSRHMGITNAVFGNETLLDAAAALISAQRAAASGEIYQKRLNRALVNVRW